MAASAPLIRQTCASVGTLCLYLASGFVMGLQTVIVPSLRDSSLHLTTEQESWLPSAFYIAMFPAQFLSGLLTPKYGRKYVILFSQFPNIVTFTMLHFAQNFVTFLMAFLISGLMAGGCAIGPMFIAEASSPKLRGIFMHSRCVTLNLGITVVHLCANFYDWRIMSLFGIIPCVIAIATTLYCPESPAWLASKGRFAECKDAFYWFRGEADSEELDQLVKWQEDVKLKKTEENKRSRSIVRRVVNFWSKKVFLKAVMLNVACVVLFETSGSQTLAMYALDIISLITGDKKNTFNYAMFFDITTVICAILSCVVVTRFKRRSLLFGIGVPSLILLLVICVVSYLFSINLISQLYSWVTLLLLSLYFGMLNLAVYPLILTITSEVYPLSRRGDGVCLSSFVMMFLSFVITKISPFLLNRGGIHGTFLMLSIFMVLSYLVLYYYLPETDNRTLQSIEMQMTNEKKTNELTKLNLKGFKPTLYHYSYTPVTSS